MGKDVLWCLGDWSFGGVQRIGELRQRLNCGDIHFILGNHDHLIQKSEVLQQNFHSVRQYAEIEPQKGVQVVLFHYPIESWINMERGAYHLHGHTHGKVRQKQGRYEVCPESKFEGKSTWLLSLDDLMKLPKPNDRRHENVAGGNKFGT
jgi:calcineurin-like phosphoesterase family protein